MDEKNLFSSFLCLQRISRPDINFYSLFFFFLNDFNI